MLIYVQWYQLEKSCLPPSLSDKYIEMNADYETQEFLAQSAAKSDQIVVQIFHSFVKSLLYWFMSSTSING